MTRRPGKMNVLWLVDHLGYNGAMHGAGKYYLNVIPAFDKSRFNVLLCVLRKEDDLTRCFEDKGINVLHLGRSKLDPMTLSDLLELTRKDKIDLIHAHGYGAANFGRMVKMITKTAIIVHAHDDDRNYPFHQKLADRLLGRFADMGIAVSESVKESFVRKRKMDEDRILVMHNGIPIVEFAVPEKERIETERKRLGVGSAAKVVGTVGKLREEKGTRYLIESAVKVVQAFPGILFLVAGDGPLKEELESLSHRLGVGDRVVFGGFCRDIPSFLSICNVVAVPSLTEGSPLALLEAMVMGKPIVASDVGGIKEVLIDGETGLLVPAKDPGALAEKIMELLKDEEKAARLGMKAKEESAKYDNDAHVRKLEERYCELLASRR